jgi:hypothetical protein
MWIIRLILFGGKKKVWVKHYNMFDGFEFTLRKDDAQSYLDRDQAVTIGTDLMKLMEIDPDGNGKLAKRLRFNGFEIIKKRS